MAAERPLHRGERGETFIELVLAMALLAILGMAGIAGLSTTATASTAQRSSARSETLLRTAAEQIQSPDLAYIPRAGCTGATTYTLPTPAVTEAGYTVTVGTVSFWPGSSASPVASAVVAFVATCPQTAAADNGLQRIELRAVDRDGRTQTLSVVKRRP